MNLGNLFEELRRRNVYRAAAAYGVVAWLLIQVATSVFPIFEIPGGTIRLVVVVLLLGFPVAMIVAWIFEWTPQGHPAHRRNASFANQRGGPAGNSILSSSARFSW